MSRILKRLISVLIMMGLAVLVFVNLPYPTQCKVLQYPLESGEVLPPDYGQLILILGAGCNPGCGTEERINLAYEYYQHKARKVIVTEGICSFEERRDFMQRMVHQWGFAREDIIWDTLSTNTQENIQHAAKLAESMHLDSIIVCTSPFHQMRANFVMDQYWEGEYAVVQMDDKHLELDRNEIFYNGRLELLVEEYQKVVYWLFYGS